MPPSYKRAMKSAGIAIQFKYTKLKAQLVRLFFLFFHFKLLFRFRFRSNWFKRKRGHRLFIALFNRVLFFVFFV